jgi:hypothetical protein
MTPAGRPFGPVAGPLRGGLSWRGDSRVAGRALAEGDDSTEDAAVRFDRAIARLEASVRSLNGRVRAHARIEADTQKLIAERQKFAMELDKQSARAKRLDDSAADVSRRLVDAMETVRGVLAK